MRRHRSARDLNPGCFMRPGTKLMGRMRATARLEAKAKKKKSALMFYRTRPNKRVKKADFLYFHEKNSQKKVYLKGIF